MQCAAEIAYRKDSTQVRRELKKEEDTIQQLIESKKLAVSCRCSRYGDWLFPLA